MRELTMNEMEEVAGGPIIVVVILTPKAIAAICTAAVAITALVTK